MNARSIAAATLPLSLTLSLGMAGCQTQASFTYEPIRPAEWPTAGWAIAPPEEEGVSSAQLVAMVEEYKKAQSDLAADGDPSGIDSITIVRNGKIVADFYFEPLFPPDHLHIVHSCTKSVLSALVGIAIEQGHLAGVDVKVVEVFPELKVKNLDDRKRSLTVQDLLTMQTGFDAQDSFLYQWRGLFELMRADDWTEHALNLPMDADPGTRFDYSNISSFLLSAILTRVTGQDTLTFAKETLFEPLGIEDVRWEQSPKGVYIGWARMWLKPHDMAKFGLLYLQKGLWEGKQVVPARWVEASTTARSYPSAYRYIKQEDGSTDFILSGGYWMFTNLARPLSAGYGYQWWLDKNLYSALGHQGQFITIVPEHNLVMVATGRLTSDNVFLPITLLNDYVLDPLEDGGKLPPASEADRLKLASFAAPPPMATTPQPVPAPPAVATRISAARFELTDNPWNRKELRLSFEPGRSWAEFEVTTAGTVRRIEVGLDGVYRMSESGHEKTAAKGRWSSPDTFVIEAQRIGYSFLDTWTLTFEADGVEVVESGTTGVHEYKGRR